LATAMFGRDDLELLVEVADGGSLIKAAKTLQVHHATAFRRLALLEQRTGIPLFDRIGQRYVTTAAARSLLVSARALMIELREFDTRAIELNAGTAEPLRVTTSDGLAIAFFPPLLRAFNDLHPEIVIDLVVDNGLMNLSERQVDVALRPARRVSGDMVCRKAGTVGYSVYASAAYVDRHGGLDAARLDFDGHAVCGYHDSIAYFTTAKWLARHARKACVVAQCNSLSAMQALARAGLCIAALPCVMGDGEKELRALLPPVAEMQTSLWVCTHPRLRKVPRVRAFLDFMHDAIAAEQPRLAGRTAVRVRAQSD